jgi:hypothetical protein
MSRKALMLAGALALAGCAGAQAPVPESPALAADNDRSCELAAGNEVRRLLAVEGSNPRVSPAPAGVGTGNARIVEIDAASAGLPVTYLFVCVVGEAGAFVSPVGHR